MDSFHKMGYKPEEMRKLPALLLSIPLAFMALLYVLSYSMTGISVGLPLSEFLSELDSISPCSSPIYLQLGSPSAQSITVKVLSDYDASISLLLRGDQLGGQEDGFLDWTSIKASVPFEIELENLKPSAQYEYVVMYEYSHGNCGVQASSQESFWTKRNQGEVFKFAITADTHLHDDGAYESSVFQETLNNMRNSVSAGDGFDFTIDMGDLFMGRKLKAKKETVNSAYDEVFKLTSVVASSSPMFLLNGNHDGESGYMLKTAPIEDDWPQDLTLAGPLDFVQARKTYFSSPTPETPGFQANGDQEFLKSVGWLGNYYSWEWGDALFVALDPYWYTVSKVEQSGWEWTLGRAQYNWLAETLAGSSQPLKFVFVHQYVGGVFGTERGYGGNGDERYARYFEWGGRGEDGEDAFAEERPGWAHGPIHALLARTGVTAVFRGHDHLSHVGRADGVVYATLPKTSSTFKYRNSDKLRAKGYDPGAAVLVSGHTEVAVGPGGCEVTFVDARGGRRLFAWGVRRRGAGAPGGEGGDEFYERILDAGLEAGAGREGAAW